MYFEVHSAGLLIKVPASDRPGVSYLRDVEDFIFWGWLNDVHWEPHLLFKWNFHDKSKLPIFMDNIAGTEVETVQENPRSQHLRRHSSSIFKKATRNYRAVTW